MIRRLQRCERPDSFDPGPMAQAVAFRALGAVIQISWSLLITVLTSLFTLVTPAEEVKRVPHHVTKICIYTPSSLATVRGKIQETERPPKD